MYLFNETITRNLPGAGNVTFSYFRAGPRGRVLYGTCGGLGDISIPDNAVMKKKNTGKMI